MCKDANAPACDRWRRVFCCFVTVGGEGSAVFSHDRAHFPARDPSYKRGRGRVVLLLPFACSVRAPLSLRLPFASCSRGSCLLLTSHS